MRLPTSCCAVRGDRRPLPASTTPRPRGAVLAAVDAGLDVPGDISITGFDDSLYAVAGMPRLTTVRLPRSDIGQTAVSMLSDRMNGRDTALVSVLSAELVARDSTGPAG